MSMIESLDEGKLAILLGGLAVIGGIVSFMVAFIAVQVRKAYLGNRELLFKQDLLDQGLSVEDVERVLRAGRPEPTLPLPTASEPASAIARGVMPPATAEPKLLRSTLDRRFAGVLGGCARYFGVDATILRVGFLLATLMTGFFPLVVTYVVAAIIIPADEVAV